MTAAEEQAPQLMNGVIQEKILGSTEIRFYIAAKDIKEVSSQKLEV